MNIYKEIHRLPQFKNAVITIGSFDGVHTGHQQILSRLTQLADEIQGESVVITFYPHPRNVVDSSKSDISVLNTLDEKLHLLKKYGIQNVVVVPFSFEFSRQSPRECIEKFIISNFNPAYVVIGYDHKFGLALVAVFRRLHEGDSISVITPSSAWPWRTLAQGAAIDVPDTGMMQGEISLHSLRTPAMIRAEAEAYKQHDPLGYELRLIAAYKARSPIPFAQWGTSDLHYHITGTAADTHAVVVGDQITLAYQGRRLEDSKVFDEVTWKGSPLTFTYGDKDQVIQGLEVAIHLLREGQEGTFLLPSLYAFGAKVINGLLEPNMPVIYTVRLEKVVRAKGTGSL